MRLLRALLAYRRKAKTATFYDIHRGLLLLEYLKWETPESVLLGFDKQNNSIIVDEYLLMHLIQIANPIQSERRIELKRFFER